MARYIGIDPGSNHCGWAILDGKNKWKLRDSGVISPEGEIETRLLQIYEEFLVIVSDNTPIKRIFLEDYFVRNAKGAKYVPYVQAMILLVAVENDIPITIINPKEIKASLLNGSASKEEMKTEVLRRFPKMEDDLLQDEYDALAVVLAGVSRGV